MSRAENPKPNRGSIQDYKHIELSDDLIVTLQTDYFPPNVDMHKVTIDIESAAGFYYAELKSLDDAPSVAALKSEAAPICKQADGLYMLLEGLTDSTREAASREYITIDEALRSLAQIKQTFQGIMDKPSTSGTTGGKKARHYFILGLGSVHFIHAPDYSEQCTVDFIDEVAEALGIKDINQLIIKNILRF